LFALDSAILLLSLCCPALCVVQLSINRYNQMCRELQRTAAEMDALPLDDAPMDSAPAAAGAVKTEQPKVDLQVCVCVCVCMCVCSHVSAELIQMAIYVQDLMSTAFLGRRLD